MRISKNSSTFESNSFGVFDLRIRPLGIVFLLIDYNAYEEKKSAFAELIKCRLEN